MPKRYILGIDQSTQGTKALLFDELGKLVSRCDLPHKQLISANGWVSHQLDEILSNVYQVVKNVVETAGIDKKEIVGAGISNQRETAAVWHRETGVPICEAVVWQCSRGREICKRVEKEELAATIQLKTGLPLSPYFSAAKIGWLLENIPGAKEASHEGKLCCGTMDSWLVYQLTRAKHFKTDYSNASRTQLFNIVDLEWDDELCKLFGIDKAWLPEVCDSDAYYGETDFNGYLENPIPIHGVLGDSQGALFGQRCLEKGQIKATYGTGSSVVMNIGEEPIFSKKGIVTSIAWKIGGKVQYILEGNINYTGAVISWLKNQLQLIVSAEETMELAIEADEGDCTYFVPAFTGLGAPYWDSEATAMITGITRVTGKKEIVRAALNSIAYQITEIVRLMSDEANIAIQELRVDGGPTKNSYLMQFQSDMLQTPVQVAHVEELSGAGIAYLSGIALGLYEKGGIREELIREIYTQKMEGDKQSKLYERWQDAVRLVLSHH